MKAKEIIATALGAMRTEATRDLTLNIASIETHCETIINILDALPDSLNVELHVEINGEQDN